MVLFSVLFVPCFYFLWKSIRPANMACGGMWALSAGCIAAVVRFFVPTFVEAYGFGISRWISAFVDYTALPVLYPLILIFIAKKNKHTSYINDSTGFIVCALIPVALVRSISWSVGIDPIRLVITPVLWVSAALIFYPMQNFLNRQTVGFNGIAKKITALLGIIATLFITTTVWCEFFAGQFLYAALLFIIPAAFNLATLIVLVKNKIGD